MIIELTNDKLRMLALEFAEKYFTSVIGPTLSDGGTQMITVKFPLLRSWDTLPMFVLTDDSYDLKNDDNYGDFTNNIHGFTLLNESKSEIMLLITRPDIQKRGVGTALINYALSEAKKERTFTGMSVKSVPSAVTFYERNGFHKVGECSDAGSTFIKMYRKS